MRDQPWKGLVRKLKAEGYESPYLERLEGRLTVEESIAQLEAEIVQEMAAALGRSEAKVEHALLRLELAARDLDAATGDENRLACLERYNALREEAIEARHHLLIHREAVGMRQNRVLERLYPIPPRRR